MVMEAPPSPQSVGREFVRQYYTLLNKAPTHLHRFYNHQSSFVHGGLDPPNRETIPVIGQKQIHQKIQQLNFRDCHAKITQVDSQATLGNGVVVQVTGELSNAGQPMRRFTQTFVLAAQSPKKYYVHNDIFRYQDEIISDEECDAENRSEPEEELNQDHQSINDVAPLSQQPMPFYPNAAPMQPNIPPVAIHHNQPQLNVLPPQAVPTVNGSVHPEDINMLPGQVPPHVPTGQALGNPVNAIQPGLVPQHVTPTAPAEESQPQAEEPVDEPAEPNYIDQPEPEAEQELPPEPVTNEPKTYANLLKSGNNTGYGSNSQPQSISLGSSQSVPRSLSPPQNNMLGNQGLNQRNNVNRNQRMNQQRIPRQDSMRGPGRTSISEEDDRRRSQSNNFGDVNQLFLGNLPQAATEEELREIFSQFGTIIDLRVHSKAINKNGTPGSRAPPNYGFITYETQLCVQNCLAAKPIFYPKDDKNGTQLNVEEKKNKDRPSFGGRPNNDNNRPRDNVQRRGLGGPGGPNRNNSNSGSAGGSVARNNSYNRSGGPPNRGPSAYSNRR